mgnify:CR=1 FL=1
MNSVQSFSSFVQSFSLDLEDEQWSVRRAYGAVIIVPTFEMEKVWSSVDGVICPHIGCVVDYVRAGIRIPGGRLKKGESILDGLNCMFHEEFDEHGIIQGLCGDSQLNPQEIPPMDVVTKTVCASIPQRFFRYHEALIDKEIGRIETLSKLFVIFVSPVLIELVIVGFGVSILAAFIWFSSVMMF